MMQPPQLGFGPTTNLPQWLGGGLGPGSAGGQAAASGGGAGDGVSRPWWASGAGTNGVCPDGYGVSTNPWSAGGNASGWQPGSNGYGAFGGSWMSSLTGLLGGLVGALQQLLGSLTGAAGGTTGAPSSPAWAPPNQHSAQQHVGDMEITSTGDPHITEQGTVLGPNGAATQVSQKYDSMASQNDLVDSAWVAGGYKVSTTVTPPNANGVTYNQTATVTANDGLDAVTMRRDGSYTITDAGSQVQLAKGKSLTLSGGETVTANADGSLTVAATNGQGSSISTLLKANGTELNGETNAHDIGLGGEVMAHARHATATAPTP